MPLLASTIVRVALQEEGVEEIDGTNCGFRVNQYKAATNLPAAESWPWCAGFVDWVVREAMRECGIQETATFKRPRTAGAWDLINWSLCQDDTTQTRKNPGSDIRAGDIVVFTFSHCGICVMDADDEQVWTVEGNTDLAGSREGGGVYRKTRPLRRIRARIRFTL